MLSSRRIRKIFYLIITLVLLMACDIAGLTEDKRSRGVLNNLTPPL